MGSSCSKTPVILSDKKKKTISSFSKVNDYKKRYEYICILGNGAFGKVRLFRDKSCKSMKFAIKTIKKEGLSDTMRNCILEEVSILRELDHPNIVKYYETYEDDFYIHLVMEYLQGEDLFKVITNRKYNNYTEKDAAEILKQLLKAVIFIHNKQIIHRDIKPENILFSVSGEYTSLKLIDFGLSTHQFTKKQVVGSPYYMAPEIIDGNYSFKTDNWSIGVILYVLMTGKYPFTGEDQKTVFNKIRYENFNLKDLQASKCSKEVKNLISKLLIKDVKDRLSIEEALEHPWFKLWDNNTKDETLHLLDKNIVDSIKEFTNKNCFHKEVMFYIAKLSRDEEVAKLKETFVKLDKDHTGTLTYDEIFKGFEEIGLKVNREDIDEIWNGLDFHQDGEVNYTEFLAATLSSMDFIKEERVWSAFKYFESTTDSGYVTGESVINALRSCGLPVNEDALNKFFLFNRKGQKLDFEEFKRIVSAKNE